MKKIKLTKVQNSALMAIIDFKINNDGCSPTARELQDILGKKSVSNIIYYLGVLERKGHIERVGKYGSGRNIKVVGGVSECREPGRAGSLIPERLKKKTAQGLHPERLFYFIRFYFCGGRGAVANGVLVAAGTGYP